MTHKLSRLFGALAVAATLVFATQARAATLGELIFDSGVFLDSSTPIILEDDLGTSSAVDGTGNVYVLGVVDIGKINRGDGSLDNFSITEIGKTTPDANVPPATSLTALVFGQVIGNAIDGFSLAPVDSVSVDITTTQGEALTITGFTGGVMVKVFIEDAGTPLALQSAIADVANVLTGNLIAEFGFDATGGNQFYDLLINGSGQLTGYELSLSLISNTSGVPIGESDLGTELYGFKVLADESATSKWDIKDDGDFKIVVIPTPAALPAGLAILGLAAVRRRRSK